EQVLALLETEPKDLTELLPEPLRQGLAMPDLRQAILYLHRPPPDAPQPLLLEGAHPAQQRLTFEELLAHQISLRELRQQQRQTRAPA
ncbi:hypothetical protein QQ73_00135, partial [Candidatus Endoriftia persephone str. Guaymas]|nr:hypothetical protein [Candidatus Endoriftia persephone str. Guaymas]